MNGIRIALAVILNLPAAASAGQSTAAEQLKGVGIDASGAPEALVRQGAVWSDGSAALSAAGPVRGAAGEARPAPATAPVKAALAVQPPKPAARVRADEGFSRKDCFKSGFEMVDVLPAVIMAVVPVLGWVAAVAWMVVAFVPAVIVGGIFAATRTYKGGF